MLSFALLKCLGKALVKYAGNAVGFGILGDLLADVGGEVWNEWSKERNEAQRRAELQELAQAAGRECRDQVQQIVQQLAAGQSPVVQQKLELYLNHVPDMIRLSLRRPADPTGTTVPADLVLRKAEDLLSILRGTTVTGGRPESSMPAKVTVQVTKGKLQGQQFVFDDRTTGIVGRADDCSPQLPDDEDHRTISRHHCLLDINPPDIRIRDFGSLNGTYVNGKKIGQREKGQTREEAALIAFPEYDLKDGDQIELGNSVFQVCIFVPAVCADCSVEIPEECKAQAERGPGVYQCEACRKQTESTKAFQSLSNKSRVCVQCGRDVSSEVDEKRQGAVLCAACKSDPLQIVRHLLDLAKSGDEDLLAIQGYEILRELGQGGMGAVYLARHEKTGEKVALKVMLPRVAVSTQARDRFLREIEVTKSLKQPHVVQLREAGCSNGTFFFTLEFCDGGSVDKLMAKQGGKLSVAEAVPIILQALDGLEYAHNVFEPGRGLVHRDLKPQNIFLAGSGNSCVAKVGDYGLAKAFDLAGLSGQTRTGAVAGTPVFMPRQQVINFKYAKPEVDVWAAAASLYNMLTGCFPRDFPTGRDPWQIVLQTNAIPICQRDPLLPARLADVIDQALIDKPAIPFNTAAEFKWALESAM